MIRAYRPTPTRPSLRDALAHWREGLCMGLPFALVFLAGLIGEALSHG